MLTLPTSVYFGKNDRFKAHQFDTHRFMKLWIADGNKPSANQIVNHSCIFVDDMENSDSDGWPDVVFQEWSDRIDHLDQVIEIIRKRYPDAFDTLYLDTIYISPQQD